MKLRGGGFGPGTFISFALLSKAGRNAVSLWKVFFFKEIEVARNWRSDFGDFFFPRFLAKQLGGKVKNYW